jgi:hypothetical protein
MGKCKFALMSLVSGTAAFESQFGDAGFIQVSEPGSDHLLILGEGGFGEGYLDAGFLSNRNRNA